MPFRAAVTAARANQSGAKGSPESVHKLQAVRDTIAELLDRIDRVEQRVVVLENIQDAFVRGQQ